MSDKLPIADEFIIKEYENAAEVTFHVDDLRDKLSTFFLTFAGAAVAVVALLLKGEFAVELFGNKLLTASLFLVGVSFIGFTILCIHARLRRVQLENFSIISRIRLYCLRDNIPLWNVIGLSPATLPRIRLRNWSGSELWALTILLPSVVLFAMGVDFFCKMAAENCMVASCSSRYCNSVGSIVMEALCEIRIRAASSRNNAASSDDMARGIEDSRLG
jgi:hypothetical protein